METAPVLIGYDLPGVRCATMGNGHEGDELCMTITFPNEREAQAASEMLEASKESGTDIFVSAALLDHTELKEDEEPEFVLLPEKVEPDTGILISEGPYEITDIIEVGGKWTIEIIADIYYFPPLA